MCDRNYSFDLSRVAYEDALPDDMTDADYKEWFEYSHVDLVRVGPWPVRAFLQE